MPLLKLVTVEPLTAEQQQALLPALSRLVAQGTGKPERYVMVALQTAAMSMAGKARPAAWVDVRSIGGLNGQVNQRLTQQVCELLERSLGVPPDRVYINFTHVAADHWGWNGNTFG